MLQGYSERGREKTAGTQTIVPLATNLSLSFLAASAKRDSPRKVSSCVQQSIKGSGKDQSRETC